MKILINTTAAIALGSAALVSLPAQAQIAPSAAVSFADLNLASENGVEMFDRRISKAIESVCGGAQPRDVARHQAFKSCVKQTKVMVEPKRDLAVSAFREGRLTARERVIRFATR